MTLFLTESDVASLVDVPDAIDILEQAFTSQALGRATSLPRQRLASEGVTLHMMAGGVDGFFGYKTFTSGASVRKAWVYLYDSSSGALAALIEAHTLGQIRTGAASGLATRWLAGEEIPRAVLFGAGFQARSQVLALDNVRPIGEILVVNRDPEKGRAFIEQMQPAVRARLRRADSPEQAVRTSRLVTTITGSAEPVLYGAWLEPGTHVNAAGGTALTRREVDPETLRRANPVVVDSVAQARVESGELHAVFGPGQRHWDEVVELKDVIRRGRVARPSGTISFFKSQGIGLEDVALGAAVYERARDRGIGRPVEL